MKDTNPPIPGSLEALFREHSVNFKQSPKALITTCPLCSKEKKMYFYLNSGFFLCWYCAEREGFSGSCEYGFSKITGLDMDYIRSKIYEDWARMNGDGHVELSLTSIYDDPEDEEGLEIELEGLKPLKKIQWPLDHYPLCYRSGLKGTAYLVKERGVPLKTCLQYDIRYIPQKRQIAFPAYQFGTLVGYQTRTTIPDHLLKGPKALTYADRAHCLLFENRLRDSETAVICEGPVDALKAHLCGGNVATMGKAVSATQVELLKKYAIRKIYLAFDPDALKEMQEVASALDGCEIYHLPPADGYKDLGQMDQEHVLQCMNEAQRYNPGRLYLFLS